MQVLIRQSPQWGDKKIHLLSCFLYIVLTFFIMTLFYLVFMMTLFSEWYTEGSGIILSYNFIAIIITIILLYYLRRTYFKIIITDNHLLLCSQLKLLNRKIKYGDILEIIVDHNTDRRRIETNKEYFEINNADEANLSLLSEEKNIKLKRINVA